MRGLLAVLLGLVLIGGFAAVASAEHRSDIPDGVEPAVPTDIRTVPCDILLRYDDGTDDSPGSGPTLGYYTGTDYQFLGVRFTPPAGGDFQVQSASWFSDFWVFPGTVDVTVTEVNNPGNTTTASLQVTDGGTWEVEFPDPICIPSGSEYVVMICPRPGCFGVIGEDYSAPDGRSYWSGTGFGCNPTNLSGSNDYMLWSCVTPCGAVPAEASTWGQIKSIYR